MLFTLEYDLRSPVRNYQPLYDELARFRAVRILESLWAFQRFDTSAEGLRNHFMRFIDSDDGLIVCQVSEWATYNTLDTPQKLAA
jgi:hypothetical protein